MCVHCKNKHTSKGFTLVELLIVIAIISTLATIVLAALNTARDKAKISATKEELTQIRNGVIQLQLDTDKSVGGCPIGGFNAEGNEMPLSDPQTGLVIKPTDLSYRQAGCQWTAQDLANWKGPYIQYSKDPWGNEYWYDPDYFEHQECDNPNNLNWIEVVVSGGPNGVNGGTLADGPYDCDDIYIRVNP